MEIYEQWLKLILETIITFGILMFVISGTISFIEFIKDQYFDN